MIPTSGLPAPESSLSFSPEPEGSRFPGTTYGVAATPQFDGLVDAPATTFGEGFVLRFAIHCAPETIVAALLRAEVPMASPFQSQFGYVEEMRATRVHGLVPQALE